jgi:TRAP-type mannitol/chloroaromatic compound transport system permease small subunit
MQGLLALSGFIDRMNEKVGRWTAWLVLVAVLISAGNAVTRKAFSLSSNGRLSNLRSGNFAENGSRILAFPLDVGPGV